MSTLVEIQDAVAQLPNSERKALQLWLNSQSEPELTALLFQRRQFRLALRIEPELQSLPFAVRKLGDGVLNFNQRVHGSGKLPRRSHFGKRQFPNGTRRSRRF